MQVELTDLQPVLERARRETDQLMVTITKKKKAADVQKAAVAKEEAVCAGHVKQSEALKAECEEALAEALPALDSAVKALKTLSKSDIVEVKSMKKPPGGVKLTMEAVCMLMGVKPKRVPNPSGRGRIDDYWEPAQKQLLGDSKFLKKLMNYDKNNIPKEYMDKIKPYGKNSQFTPAVIKNASTACAGLCKWGHAMIL